VAIQNQLFGTIYPSHLQNLAMGRIGSMRTALFRAITQRIVTIQYRCFGTIYRSYITLILLTWRIWRALNNASRWQMGFNLAFKGLKGQEVGSDR